MPYITEYEDSRYAHPRRSNYSIPINNGYSAPQSSVTILSRGGPSDDSYMSLNSTRNSNYDPRYNYNHNPPAHSSRMLNSTANSYTAQPTYNALQVPQHNNNYRSRSLGDYDDFDSTPTYTVARANSSRDVTTQVLKYTSTTVYKYSTTRTGGGGGGEGCGCGGRY